MDKNELGQLKDHANGIFKKLKSSHKLGLVIAVVVTRRLHRGVRCSDTRGTWATCRAASDNWARVIELVASGRTSSALIAIARRVLRDRDTFLLWQGHVLARPSRLEAKACSDSR